MIYSFYILLFCCVKILLFCCVGMMMPMHSLGWHNCIYCSSPTYVVLNLYTTSLFYINMYGIKQGDHMHVSTVSNSRHILPLLHCHVFVCCHIFQTSGFALCHVHRTLQNNECNYERSTSL